MTKGKGNYYLNKTIDFFRVEGYEVSKSEIMRRIQKPDGSIIFTKTDLFGADAIAINDEEILFLQSKTNKGHIAEALKEFKKFPCPLCCRQLVVYWEPRAKEPELHYVEKEE